MCLLSVTRDADPDGGRAHQAPSQRPRRRQDLRHRPPRLLPPLCDHHGARALVHGQTRLPDHAGRRDPADRQRRPPVPHRARLEACDRRGAGPAAAPVPDRQQQADGDGRVRRATQGHRRLPTGLPLRHGARRWLPGQLSVLARRSSLVPSGAGRRGRPEPHPLLPWHIRHRDIGAHLFRSPRAAEGYAGNLCVFPGRGGGDQAFHRLARDTHAGVAEGLPGRDI